MNLQDLTQYNNIVIQCHDVPDADAISSGFALMKYFESKGGSARLIYGGRHRITKPNLKLMLKWLKIPIEWVSELERPDLLITVDSQYGAGNITKFAADNIAVFDHHRPEIPESPYVIIYPALGSCATLVWDLMRHAGFDFAAAPEVYNALYYGLFTDTNHLSEMRHPLDRDLAEFMPVDSMAMRKLQHSELTIDELSVVSQALSSSQIISDIGLLKTTPCDPNILGFSCDIARQVDQFDSCIVYCHIPIGLKLSIRSTVREIMANDLAVFLAQDVGAGGGSIDKAGACLNYEDIERIAHGKSPDDYLRERIQKYQDNFDLVYCDHHNLDFAAAERFVKLPRPLGCARSVDIFPEDTPVRIRTLEGDIDMVASHDTYIMIGINNEVYPIKREKFERDYDVTDENYVSGAEYPPSIIDRIKGKRISLLPFTRTCVPRASKHIRAIQLQKDVKVFTNWDKEKYFLGKIGDYIAAPEADFHDVYVINGEIFAETYALAG
jgi:phosphoglycolate phosphatase